MLDVEQLRREQSSLDVEDPEAVESWCVCRNAIRKCPRDFTNSLSRNEQYSELVEQLWNGLRVMVPLETRQVLTACLWMFADVDIFKSDPHPFISLIAFSKGKKLLPRISRHLSSQQMLTVLTLLVACFSQMDIVLHAHILDLPEESTRQQDLERQTQAFLGSIIQSILPVVAKAGLRLVSGLLGLLLERSDIVSITQTRVCISTLHYMTMTPTDRLRVAWPGHFDIVSQPRRVDQTEYVNCRGSFGASHTRRNRAMV